MNTVFCRRCRKEVVPYLNPRPDTPHYAEYKCPDCQGFINWVAKPDNQKKLDKRPNGCPTPEDLDIEICQVCLRPREWLGQNETLETHHIDDEPTHNDRLNLLVVCTACHKFINWIRIYFNKHLQGMYEGDL